MEGNLSQKENDDKGEESTADEEEEHDKVKMYQEEEEDGASSKRMVAHQVLFQDLHPRIMESISSMINGNMVRKR